jgi:hypothetical protein
MQAVGGRLSGPGSIGERLARLHWEAIERSLGEWGYAKTPPILTPEEWGGLARLPFMNSPGPGSLSEKSRSA